MAPVSIMVKPRRWASWRATVLLPAPAGPSMATMGALTKSAHTTSDASGVQGHQHHDAQRGDGAHGPRQPLPRSTVRLGQLLVFVAGDARSHPIHALRDQDGREDARAAQEEDDGESGGDDERDWLHDGRKLCAPRAGWLVQRSGQPGGRLLSFLD